MHIQICKNAIILKKRFSSLNSTHTHILRHEGVQVNSKHTINSKNLGKRSASMLSLACLKPFPTAYRHLVDNQLLCLVVSRMVNDLNSQ